MESPMWETSALDFFRTGKSSKKILYYIAYSRNLKVRKLTENLFIVAKGDKSIGFYSSMPSTTPFISLKCTSSKNITKQLFSEAGINTPAGKVFTRDQYQKALEYFFSVDTCIPADS